MNAYVAIALRTMRTVIKELDFNKRLATRISGAIHVREGAVVIAQATDGDAIEIMAYAGRKTTDDLKHGAGVSSHSENRGSTPATHTPSEARKENSSPHTCVHLAQHVRSIKAPVP
jgi:hypothetical protein